MDSTILLAILIGELFSKRPYLNLYFISVVSLQLYVLKKILESVRRMEIRQAQDQRKSSSFYSFHPLMKFKRRMRIAFSNVPLL